MSGPRRGLLLLLAVGLCLELPQSVYANGALKVTAEYAIPPELRRANDVRWAGDKSLFIGVTATGVIEAPLEDLKGFKILVPDARHARTGLRLPGIWAPSRLGISDRYLAIGAPVFEVGWYDRLANRFAGKAAIEGIEDLDLQGDRLLVVGMRRGENGEMSPDGAVAWIGTLARELTDLKPVLFSISGVGARAMDNCANFEISAVRFLPGGGFVVATGTEPGIHLFDSSARLKHVWNSESLGLDPLCQFDTEKTLLLARDPEARWSWINQFRTIDDILPLSSGPGLVLRSHSGGITRWQLVVLHPERAPQTWILPFSSPSALSHLRGDVRGGRIVFLQLEQGRPEKPVAVTPRILLVETPP